VGSCEGAEVGDGFGIGVGEEGCLVPILDVDSVEG